MQKTYRMTEEGKINLENELEHLSTDVRAEINEALKFARSNGDLSENADYSAAIEARNQNEDKIAMIIEQLNHCEVVKPEKGIIGIGSSVDFKDSFGEDTILIVGATEADYMEGKISDESPLGAALLGKKVGEKVSVKGEEYEIIAIRP